MRPRSLTPAADQRARGLASRMSSVGRRCDPGFLSQRRLSSDQDASRLSRVPSSDSAASGDRCCRPASARHPSDRRRCVLDSPARQSAGRDGPTMPARSSPSDSSDGRGRTDRLRRTSGESGETAARNSGAMAGDKQNGGLPSFESRAHCTGPPTGHTDRSYPKRLVLSQPTVTCYRSARVPQPTQSASLCTTGVTADHRPITER